MGMFKSDPPPAPDYSGIATSSKEVAEIAAATAREQLAWAKEQYANDKQITDRVVNAALSRQEELDANARSDRARYETKFQPLEQQLIDDAAKAGSAPYQEQKAGGAMAEVSRQYEIARQEAQDQLESYGIDPSQTRAQALDVSTRINEATARASAGNQAREQEEAKGRALRSEALNIGKGYPGQIAQQYGTALASGNQAANSALAQTASGANTMGTGLQWTNQQNQALGTWGNALTGGYNAQLNAFNAQQNSSSGIGSLLGLAGGIGSALFLEEGGAVPEEASPSRGAIPDDVPAQLQAGEFVVPEDVVRWLGERHFQQLIEKSRVAKESAPAKGELSTRTAIPMGA
jgi:hypothetical protein